MQIVKNLPVHWLNRSQEILATFVVMGPGYASTIAGYHAGRIKTVLFGPSVQSPLLVVQPIMRDGRMIGCKGIHLTSFEAEKGSMFLRDMYKDEGRLADYERYVAREKAIRAGMAVDAFDEYDPRLPAKLVEWRRGKGVKDKFEWDAAPTGAPSDEIEDLGEPEVETITAPSMAAAQRAPAPSAGTVTLRKKAPSSSTTEAA